MQGHRLSYKNLLITNFQKYVLKEDYAHVVVIPNSKGEISTASVS
jgi:hypothetical protein